MIDRPQNTTIDPTIVGPLSTETEQASDGVSRSEATDQKPEQATGHIEPLSKPDAESEQPLVVVPQGKAAEQAAQLQSNTVPQEIAITANQVINTDTLATGTGKKNTEPLVATVRNDRIIKRQQRAASEREKSLQRELTNKPQNQQMVSCMY